MPSQYAVIPFDPQPLLLESYAKTLKRKALAARKIHQDRIDSANAILQKCYDKHPELVSKVKKFKVLIQLNTRGDAATESVLDTGLDSTPQEEAVAKAFLLKKAYKQAAAMAHPDKGGSHEDFVAINAAYRAKDIDSITEFLLSKHRSILDQISYWQSEQKKPEVSWTRFRSTPEFGIVRLYTSGNKERAEQMALEVLNILLASLTAQLTHYHPRMEENPNGNEN